MGDAWRGVAWLGVVCLGGEWEGDGGMHDMDEKSSVCVCFCLWIVLRCSRQMAGCQSRSRYRKTNVS